MGQMLSHTKKQSRKSAAEENNNYMINPSSSVLNKNVLLLNNNNTKIGEDCIILGSADSGKSTFFKMAEFLCSGDGNGLVNCGKFIPDEQFTSYLMMGKLFQLLDENEKNDLKRNIPQIFESAWERVNNEFSNYYYEESKIAQEYVSNFDFRGLLIYLWWNIPHFQQLYETKWNSIKQNISKHLKHRNLTNLCLLSFFGLENLEKFVSKIQLEIKSETFLPFSLCYIPTCRLYDFQFKHGRFLDMGGARNERKKWTNVFEYQNTLLLTISLSELDQYLQEDENILKVEDSRNLFGELARSRFFENSRKIILFTKPDILMKKLRNGHVFNLASCKMISELRIIEDDYVRHCVNSIISYYLKNLDNGYELTRIHSFHIVNTTEMDQVKSVLERIFDENLQFNTFISPCLLTRVEIFQDEMKKKLIQYSKQAKLTDININIISL